MTPDLTGATLGHFRLVAQIGQGQTATVYRAFAGVGGEQQVAVKVLHPELSNRTGFLERLQKDIGLVSMLRHPHLLPVHAHGTAGGVVYVAMALAAGGSLKERLQAGRLPPERALPVIEAVAGALHRAHEAGVVHRDIKPGNVLFDASGLPMLADFGLARTNFGFAVGTPGYMAPEQAMGAEPDGRADVYGLGVVVFEMLTGTPLRHEVTAAELLRATVEAPLPLARDRQPDLPADLDAVLGRALAWDARARHRTSLELLADLAQILGFPVPPAVRRAPEPVPETVVAATETEPLANGRAVGLEEDFERDTAHLMRLVDNSLTPAIAIDELSYVVGWNGAAERTFGWPRDEILGRMLATTLIPPRHREGHERGFKRYLESGEGPVLDTVIQITALHRDGREFPVELSISPGARSDTRALVIGFARDITPEKRAEQIRAAQAQVTEALEGAGSLTKAAPGVLEAIGANLDWSIGTLWEPGGEGSALRCAHVWKGSSVAHPEFEQAVAKAAFQKGEGLPGRVWETGEAVWVEDVLNESSEPRVVDALRSGLHGAVAFPVVSAGEVRGVIEFFSTGVLGQDEDLLLRLYEIGRRIGRHAGRGQAEGGREAPAEG